MSSGSDIAPSTRFDPGALHALRFVSRSLDEHGVVRLGYALDDAYTFEELFTLPLPPAAGVSATVVNGLLDLLHWIAGVSYYKAASPPEIVCETGSPQPATAALLEALYSEGLGEYAVVNGLPALPHPRFRSGPAPAGAGHPPRLSAPQRRAALERVLVPVGGGKDSAVALEIVRCAGLELALFSVGDAPPIAGTVRAAGLPRLQVTRRIDPRLIEANRNGARNGHVPVTAIVAAVALLTAALHGFDAVALANERSASAPNMTYDGVEINHQFSKSARAERLLSAAVAEIDGAPAIFSVLRPGL